MYQKVLKLIIIVQKLRKVTSLIVYFVHFNHCKFSNDLLKLSVVFLFRVTVSSKDKKEKTILSIKCGYQSALMNFIARSSQKYKSTVGHLMWSYKINEVI